MKNITTAAVFAVLSLASIGAHAEQTNDQKIQQQIEDNRARMLDSLHTAGMAWTPLQPQLWLTVGTANHVTRDIGLEYRLQGDVALTAGTYRHDDSRSRYASLLFTPFQYGPIKFGLNAGALDGYASRREGRYQAFIAPAITVTYGRFGVNFTALPGADGRANGRFAVKVKALLY
jgi:hypothetical protein